MTNKIPSEPEKIISIEFELKTKKGYDIINRRQINNGTIFILHLSNNLADAIKIQNPELVILTEDNRRRYIKKYRSMALNYTFPRVIGPKSTLSLHYNSIQFLELLRVTKNEIFFFEVSLEDNNKVNSISFEGDNVENLIQRKAEKNLWNNVSSINDFDETTTEIVEDINPKEQTYIDHSITEVYRNMYNSVLRLLFG